MPCLPLQFTAFRSGRQKRLILASSIRACCSLHQAFRELTFLEGLPLCGLWSSASARRAVHGGDDGTAGGLPASNRPDETSDDVQGLRQGCFAACRPVLQCRDGQIAGIWETPQEQTTAEDRVGRQEFLP